MEPVVRWVELGRIGSPFGVRGWVHVTSYTDPPERLISYRTWTLRNPDGTRVERRLAEGRLQGNRLVARLEGVEDRDAAAALRGAVIEIERSELPPTREREYYRADLIGLVVRNLEGVELGRVDYFIDAPANAVMVVRGEREHWLPVTPVHLRSVDLDAGLILVDWPAELE
nr:MAG: 16S rRNA processing protein RimM [Pseudomonadota bacterium]